MNHRKLEELENSLKVALLAPAEDLPQPWPDLQAPPYKEGSFGPWTIRCQKYDNRKITGYYSTAHTMQENWMLTKRSPSGRENIWMSLTPMELESQAPFVWCMEGTVVICGLGMGMVAYNAIQKPEVDEVYVIEKDPAVIKAFTKLARPEKWPNYKKLKIINEDAITFDPICVEVDHLYVDIWQKLGDSRALANVRSIQANIGAGNVGWWGQEFDYVAWGMQNDIRVADLASLAHWRAFTDYTKLPMVPSMVPEYPVLAVEAIKRQIAAPALELSSVFNFRG